MTSAGISSLGDYVRAAAAPYASAALIGPEAWNRVQQVASQLPGSMTEFFGFECRLGETEASTDFLVCAEAAHSGRDVLAGKTKVRSIPAHFSQQEAWQRVERFVQLWSDSASPLHQAVHNMWLEFDLDTKPGSVPQPCVFIGSNDVQPGKPWQWLNELALPALSGCETNAAARARITECIDALPPGARIFQIGVMLSRFVPVTRLCVRGLPSSDITGYLTTLGWKGSPKELGSLVDTLSKVSARIDLDFDLDGCVLPKIGLECYLPMEPSPVLRFLEYLVSAGLCTPMKAEALAEWRGMAHEIPGRAVWPQDLLALSAFFGGRFHSVFVRWLHHVKVVYEPGLPLAAKAYLAVKHFWIAPSSLKEILRAARPQEGSTDFLSSSAPEGEGANCCVHS